MDSDPLEFPGAYPTSRGATGLLGRDVPPLRGAPRQYGDAGMRYGRSGSHMNELDEVDYVSTYW